MLERVRPENGVYLAKIENVTTRPQGVHPKTIILKMLARVLASVEAG